MIHNGIITNYKDLKKFLVSRCLFRCIIDKSQYDFICLIKTTHPLTLIPQESKGYEFESETDTETIAKLVKYMYDNRESDDINFATLVERVIQQLVQKSY